MISWRRGNGDLPVPMIGCSGPRKVEFNHLTEVFCASFAAVTALPLYPAAVIGEELPCLGGRKSIYRCQETCCGVFR